MRIVLNHIVRFFVVIALQVLVLNQTEIGFGILGMIYPLFVFLLPVEIGVITLMVLSFIVGITIDSLSNTYGLHTSSLLMFSYMRPVIFKLFAPRDGYDPLLELHVFDMGQKWFVKSFGLLLLIHHFWFFTLEIFNLGELGFVLQKTALSLIFSFFLTMLFQYLFLGRKKTKNAV